MSELWDAPNQQVVREDQSPPWEEGDGGSPDAEPKASGLDAMTKTQLLEYAAANGIEADESMTKAEVRSAIDVAEG